MNRCALVVARNDSETRSMVGQTMENDSPGLVLTQE
jgi:hypothetical protein